MDLIEKLSPKHTALLVIDVQIDFCSPTGLLAKRGRDFSLIEPMIDMLLPILQLAESAKVLTLYTQQIYDRKQLNVLQTEQYDLDGKLVTCDISTEGYKFYRINPPKDNVFPKYDYNIFSNDALRETLSKHNIKTLVVAGVDTYICVETAIRNGFDLGYKIVVAEDLVACSARKINFHHRTLDIVRNTYGVVINSKELYTYWR